MRRTAYVCMALGVPLELTYPYRSVRQFIYFTERTDNTVSRVSTSGGAAAVVIPNANSNGPVRGVAVAPALDLLVWSTYVGRVGLHAALGSAVQPSQIWQQRSVFVHSRPDVLDAFRQRAGVPVFVRICWRLAAWWQAT